MRSSQLRKGLINLLLVNFVVNGNIDPNAEEFLRKTKYLEAEMEPQFIPSAETNLTVESGKTATLACLVRQRGGHKIVWLRKKDNYIIAVNDMLFISDERFHSKHRDSTGRWSLSITNVSQEDSGIYECQIPSERKRSQIFQLNIIASYITINGDSQERFVKNGSVLNLICVVTGLFETVREVTWYKNGLPITRKPPSLRISNRLESSGHLQSNLTIKGVTKTDSGNYTCTSESIGSVATIDLFVINGENQAAMKYTDSAPDKFVSKSTVLLCFFAPLINCLLSKRSR